MFCVTDNIYRILGSVKKTGPDILEDKDIIRRGEERHCRFRFNGSVVFLSPCVLPAVLYVAISRQLKDMK